MNRRAFVQGLVAAGATDAELASTVLDRRDRSSRQGGRLRARHTDEEPWRECIEPDCRIRWQAPRGSRGRCLHCWAEEHAKRTGFRHLRNFIRPLGGIIIQARRDNALDLSLLEAGMRADFGDDFFDRHLKWAFECSIKEKPA